GPAERCPCLLISLGRRGSLSAMTARPSTRTLRVERADASLAVAIAAVRNAAADRLTSQYGHRHWSGHRSQPGVLGDIRHGAVVHVALWGADVVGTMTLGTRKPWAIDPKYFASSLHPVYLTNMAVAPDRQRHGVGRACLLEAARIAAAWPADAI